MMLIVCLHSEQTVWTKFAKTSQAYFDEVCAGPLKRDEVKKDFGLFQFHCRLMAIP